MSDGFIGHFYLYYFFRNFAENIAKINNRQIIMKRTTILLLFAIMATTMFAQIATPVFNTTAGTYYNPFSIEISGNDIYYTIDGTEPTNKSNKYTGAISINKFGTSTTVTAASYANGTWSKAVTATYELKVAAPEFSVKSGVYEKLTGDDALNFTTETTGATIYYNDRGKSPITEGSKLYGSLSILATKTISAVAFVTDEKGNKIYSDISSEYYAISPIALFTEAKEIKNSKYIICYDTKVASSFYEHIESGNLNTRNVINSKNQFIETNEFDGFTVTGTTNGYTIQDAYNRYLYMDDNNKLCAANKMPSAGAVWSISIDNTTSVATIKNTSKGKFIAYDLKEMAFGIFDSIDENHALPQMYNATEYPTITITPQDGDTLTEFSKFTVTCESGLKYKETNKLYAYYNIGYDTSKKEFDNVDVIDSNTIEFTLDKPIKSSDNYKLVFPAGVFTMNPTGLAKTNKEIIARYTVANNEILEVTYANPSNKEISNSLQYLYFEFNQDINIKISNAVITDKNGKEYTLSVSDIDSWGEKCNENALCLMTAEPITVSGEYTFVLKQEHICAKSNTALTIAKNVTYTFIVEEALKITNVTPNSKDIYDSVNEIVIEFNKAALHGAITEIVVTDSNKQSYTFSKTTTGDEATSLKFVAASPLTNAGTYSFTIANNVIYCESANSDMDELESIPETTFSFVVKYPTSVDEIDAEGKEQVIYDLTGRRIESTTQPGIYIRNGKKIIIK